MGAEAKCHAEFQGLRARGTARLEADTLQFRGGELRIALPFAAITKVAASGGTLSVTGPAGTATFELGSAAEKWVEKIKNPRSRLQKLGARPEWRVSAVGVEDRDFLRELERAVEYLSIGRVVKNSDAIFFGATRAAQLARLESLKGSLKPNGAVWVVRPKGRPEISESAVMHAGKAAGLVDVKVVSFSPTHTAEKFVIPLARRR
jgi:hypothetical protein